MKNCLAVLTAILILTGCSTAEETIEQQCLAKGGSWQQEGKLQSWQCVIKYADGGKTCSQSSECKGSCIVHDYPKDNEPFTGVCADSDSPFGCRGIIEDVQKGGGILCVD